MKKEYRFPFAAVVGQSQAKQALCIAAVNKKAGGLLLIGAKGTGKSILARSITDIIATPLVDIPLNITEDMIAGGLDFAATIRSGEKNNLAGILTRAAGNIVYIDDAHLIGDTFLRSLLAVAAGETGEGDISCTVIGTVNQEEGGLSAAIFDRFGMSVEMEVERKPENRVQIMRRVIAFEDDAVKFSHDFADETQALQQIIEQAQSILPAVKISKAILELATVYSEKGNCVGHRAELFLLEAAKAVAALAKRDYVLPQDVDTAAQYVLPHRMRQMKQPPPKQEASPDMPESNNDDHQHEGENESETSAEGTALPAEENQNDDRDNTDDKPPNEPTSSDRPDATADHTEVIDENFARLKMQVELSASTGVKRGSGKRAVTKTDLKQGRYVRSALPKGTVTDLAFDATIRAAAPYQRLRPKGECALRITSDDLRRKVREKRIGNTFLFVVDASGSMGAKMRMKAVKGTIFTLLQDAYQKRDQVGMIAFRRDAAEVVLPVTRSIDLAQKCLGRLPTGGKTPLAEGLTATLNMLHTLDRTKNSDLEPVVILLTDGRANYGSGRIPVENALAVAAKFADLQVRSVVIDTETDFIKLGIAPQIARTMQAAYYSLKQLSEQDVLKVVKATY